MGIDVIRINSVLLAALNAGGAYAADALAAYAFTNTTISGSVAMLGWLYWSHKFGEKMSLSAALVGAVVGLATITPAAGYVEPWSAVLIGLIGSTVCFFAKRVQDYFHIDDALEVWRAHGMGELVGAILISVFASRLVGAVNAGFHLFCVQVMAVVLVALYSWGVTVIILKLLNVNGKLRVNDCAEIIGLDEHEHGENAYNIKK